MKRRASVGKGKGKGTEPFYPTAEQALKDRRHFLEIVGKGALGVSLLGAAACGGAADPEKINHGDGGVLDTTGEPDWTTMGVAPEDTRNIDTFDTEQIELGGVAPQDTVEIRQEWEIQGGAPMPDVEDIQEEDWNIAGGLTEPDTCTYPLDVEGEFPALPGEMPAPDTVSPDTVDQEVKPDTEDPPLDGDMPMPEEP